MTASEKCEFRQVAKPRDRVIPKSPDEKPIGWVNDPEVT
jgi:hypothetical protein